MMKNQIRCTLDSISPLQGDVYHVVLIPEQAVKFDAGQYLQVILSEYDKRPFSIANAPEKANRIELHIGATKENSYTMEVLLKLKEQGYLDVELPLGDASFKLSERPMLFLIGGTGFSYANSIIDHCLAQGLTNPISLYWGVRKREFMYHYDIAIEWQSKNEHITFIPVVEYPDSDWDGKTGIVHKVLLEQHPNLSEYNIYVAGRFEMAKAARTDFIAAGADVAHIYGDAFAFID